MAKGSKGHIVQIIGTVVDVEFPADEMPGVMDAVELSNDGRKVVMEVQQHVGNNWVRCLSLAPPRVWQGALRWWTPSAR